MVQPKVLIPVLGVPLIQRTISVLKEFDITEITIVTGFKADQIKDTLGTGSKFGVQIDYITNTEYERGNALSILKAEKLIDDRFLLLMGDHLISNQMIEKIIKSQGDLVIAVDFQPRHIDTVEATKVRIKYNYLKEISKELTQFNAIDTGVFLCAEKIFPTIRKCITQGKEEFSDCIQEYAKQNRVNTCDVSGSIWFDIDTKDDLRRCEKTILKSMTKPGDGFISKNLNRKISTRISKRLVKTGITPNQITLMSTFLALVSTIFFSIGNQIYVFSGGIVAQTTSILDGCDGEIARLKMLDSPYGSWLDASLDRYVDAMIILGISYGYWLNHKDILIWIISFCSLIGSFMVSYTQTRYVEAFKQDYKNERYSFGIGRDVRLFIIFLADVTNQALYFLILLAILTNLSIAQIH